MQPYLLDVLADPQTHEPLTRASDDELASLRTVIAEGRARRRDGEPIPPFEGAFLTRDRKVVYLVESGVPNFVLDERIELEAAL